MNSSDISTLYIENLEAIETKAQLIAVFLKQLLHNRYSTRSISSPKNGMMIQVMIPLKSAKPLTMQSKAHLQFVQPHAVLILLHRLGLGHDAMIGLEKRRPKPSEHLHDPQLILAVRIAR